MTINKLAIIGGSGLYDVEEFKNRELLDLNTPWGKPSDQILKTNYNNKEVYFLPRHGKNHTIPPHKINYKANIYANRLEYLPEKLKNYWWVDNSGILGIVYAVYLGLSCQS